jgi:hypothetical protein
MFTGVEKNEHRFPLFSHKAGTCMQVPHLSRFEDGEFELSVLVRLARAQQDILVTCEARARRRGQVPSPRPVNEGETG